MHSNFSVGETGNEVMYVREEHIVGDVVEVSSVLQPGSCSTGEEGRWL